MMMVCGACDPVEGGAEITRLGLGLGLGLGPMEGGAVINRLGLGLGLGLGPMEGGAVINRMFATMDMYGVRWLIRHLNLIVTPIATPIEAPS